MGDTVTIVRPDGSTKVVSAASVNGVKLPDGYSIEGSNPLPSEMQASGIPDVPFATQKPPGNFTGPMRGVAPPTAAPEQAPTGMGDVQSEDAPYRAVKPPGKFMGAMNTLGDATTSAIHGMTDSPIGRLAMRSLIQPDVADEFNDLAEHAQRDSPTASSVGEFAGNLATPESAMMGEAGTLLKAALQASRINKMAKAMGLKLPGKTWAGAQGVLKKIMPELSAEAAAKEVLPGAGAAVGGGGGLALGGPWGAEFGAAAGSAAGRSMVGMPPLATGGWRNMLTGPGADIGRMLKSPFNPAVQSQTAKLVPPIARLMGARAGRAEEE